MTLLYPRLDPIQGVALLREHRGRSVDELRRAAGLHHPGAVYAPTGGTTASTEHLADIARSIRAVAEQKGYPAVARESERTSFDRLLAVDLHELMAINPSEAAARDVWTFLAVQVTPDVVAWRFGFENDERWIGSDLTRHTLARLWWQAHTLGVAEASRWTYDLLNVLSESELNQVFERRTIGGTPSLVRAIARAVQSVPPTGIARRLLIRDAIKRLRRLLPFTCFHCLPDDILDSRINELLTTSAKVLLADRR